MRTTLQRILLLFALLWVVLVSACATTIEEGAAEEAPESVGGKADGQTVLDPCRSYPDRVRLLRMLKDKHPYPFAGTASAWRDGRDGFITQTEWQFRSGRATRSPSGDTLWGWWANVNYTLTAWQLMVLQRRGELPDVHMVEYLDAERFGPTAEAERSIVEYYDEIDRTRALAEANQLTAADIAQRQARLQQLMWKVHSEALEVGRDRNADLLARLPFAERRFSRAWGYSVVDILTAVNFPTDQRVEELNRLFLPARIVRTNDLNPLASSDLGATERAGVVALVLFDEFEQRSSSRALRTVQGFITSAERATIAADQLIQLFRTGNVLEFIRALGGS